VQSGRESSLWFAIALIVAAALKLAVVSDLTVLIQHNPQDDGLYVARAYYLLTEGGFGPYDARTLVKLPGMSFWLAGGRLLGLPYLWSMNILYVLAGCYLLVGVLQCGAGRPLALAAFVAYLFNPITMGSEWTRVMREALSTGLFIVMFASALFMLLRLEARRIPLGHLAVFSLAFAFSILLREEDVLLYAVLAMLCVAGWWITRRVGSPRAATRAFVLSVAIVPLLLAGAANAAARQFVERSYGLPLLHDFSEGEFPKLMAAIRGIESKKDNRYVMITRERLAKLLVEVPSLVPVINRLPLPGPGTASCLLYKVCSETANGWSPFWIKDAAWEAGLTPSLPKAQEFFRAARQDIERACAEGRLKCHPNGQGLLPPFELRWTRAYMQELFALFSMTIRPRPDFLLPGAPSSDSMETVPGRYTVDANFGRTFQFVTMTHDFDTEVQAKGVAATVPRYANPLASWRSAIRDIYGFMAPVIVLLTVAAFAVRLVLWRRVLPGALSLTAAIFVGYALIRVAALSYASVYLGQFDSRIMFSTHSFMLLFGFFVMADAVNAVRAAKLQRQGNE
jgi:hypothetical protein